MQTKTAATNSSAVNNKISREAIVSSCPGSPQESPGGPTDEKLKKRKQKRQQVSHTGIKLIGSQPAASSLPEVAQTTREAINFHSYRQTGVKSRPVKLLKHPIENIERKIIITYIIGFLFKLIAILSGPLIVLLAYLLVLPSILIRRSIWFLLNLSCLFDARIKTTVDNDDDANSIGDEKSLNWNYCPLTYLETFWLKEKLVNNVILVIDQDCEQDPGSHSDQRQEAAFSIDKFRDLIRESILSKPAYRKFLSCVVPIGLPFYKSYFWHYLGLATAIPVPEDITRPTEIVGVDGRGQANHGNGAEPISSSKSSSQFSITRSVSLKQDNACGGEFVQVLLAENATTTTTTTTTTETRKAPAGGHPRPSPRVYLSNHIYIDSYFIDSEAFGNARDSTEKTKIRRYACSLTKVNLDMTRPLWEIRVVPTQSGRRTYLIFRCHQSLADGHSLTAILTDHLTATRGADEQNDQKIFNPSEDGKLAGGGGSGSSENLDFVPGEKEEEEEEEEKREARLEKELRPIGEKKSFVSKVSKCNSYESSVLVGPLTVLLWVIWTFTRRRNNHLNKCSPTKVFKQSPGPAAGGQEPKRKQRGVPAEEDRRFYMTHYDLTKFHQIKQMTRSTVSDVILCALSGALRNYLRKFNGVSNPPTLNVSLTVNMRQEATSSSQVGKCKPAGKQVNQTTTASGICDGGGPESVSVLMEAAGEVAAPARKRLEKAQVNCTLVNVPLPTSVEGTVPRLWELRTTMDELRTSADPWVMLGLQKILFLLLPISWYQRLINYIALRNSSIFVSNIRGPVNVVESWCVDLFQRAIYEAQQTPRKLLPAAYQPDINNIANIVNGFARNKTDEHSQLGTRPPPPSPSPIGTKGKEDEEETRRDKKMRNSSKLRLINKLGRLSAIYYCMQPPTSEIPISFNCITYHNKLFVTSLSRSLLVEDSKLLIKLFFAQLNQLANTIAKRKSFFTIIRTPIPIEISCQPASPVLERSKSFRRDSTALEVHQDHNQDEEEEEEEEEEAYKSDVNVVDCQTLQGAAAETSSGSEPERVKLEAKEEESAFATTPELDKSQQRRKLEQGVRTLPATTKLSSPLQTKTKFMKDDIEANLGGGGETVSAKCSKCRQFVCTCRRRKSLFSLDTNQRSANLFSLLHPNYYLAGRRPSKSGEPESANSIMSQQQQIASECLCGQQLLEELDEDLEGDNNNDNENGGSSDLLNRSICEKELSRESVGSRTPSDDCGRFHRVAIGVRGSNCAKCRYNSARSLRSLGDSQPDGNQQIQQSHRARQQSKNRSYLSDNQKSDVMNKSNTSLSSCGHRCTPCPYDLTSSNQSNSVRNKMATHLDEQEVCKFYSKSETDLLPMSGARTKPGNAKRTLSKEPSSANTSKESWFVIGRNCNRRISTIFHKTPFNSSFKVKRSAGSSSPVSPVHGRSRNMIGTSRDLINMPSKRRQSVATTTGASSSVHRSVVVKDEINADVNLRYHLDGSILRNRRFSTIGSAVVGTQRRSSLIPFGLMNNQAFPKLIRDEGETHL